MSPPTDAERIAAAALAEDGDTDVTSVLTVPAGLIAQGRLEYHDGGVLAGSGYAEAVAVACRCEIHWTTKEGVTVAPGTTIGRIRGELAAILRAERPMLNLLQRACGIATMTRAYVDSVRGTGTRILHTRKTAPGLRPLDVAAVIAGGGSRHRVDLAHEVMVKDNHWRAVGHHGLAPALAEAKRRGLSALYVEVESVEQLELACAAGATRLLVDNQAPATVREWATRARGLVPGIELEATGGITLANVRYYAEAGSDFVSIGALTHSVRAADISLEAELSDRSSRG